MTRDEVRAVMSIMEGVPQLIVKFLYAKIRRRLAKIRGQIFNLDNFTL